jgi:Spy/CpxP family protein refolding chaperone
MTNPRSLTNLIGIFTVALAIGGSALLVAESASAHTGRNGPMGPERMEKMADKYVEHMAKAVDATPEQKAKLQAIAKAAQSDIKPLHEQVRARMDKALAESKEVLTPEQRAKWDAKMQSHRGHRGERMGMHEKK